jgi:hypothetical protein
VVLLNDAIGAFDQFALFDQAHTVLKTPIGERRRAEGGLECAHCEAMGQESPKSRLALYLADIRINRLGGITERSTVRVAWQRRGVGRTVGSFSCRSAKPEGLISQTRSPPPESSASSPVLRHPPHAPSP